MLLKIRSLLTHYPHLLATIPPKSDSLLEVSRNIKTAPFIGRVVPELGDEDIRERFVYSYRLVYQLNKQEIIILAIIHGKRLLENIQGRFGE